MASANPPSATQDAENNAPAEGEPNPDRQQRSTQSATDSAGAGLKSKLLRNPFFWAALAGLVAVPLLRPWLRRVPEPPPVLFQVPQYQLTNQAGRSFGSTDLRGDVHIVTFFFTHCPSICPKLMQAMLGLQRRYASFDADIKMVSISVDPTVDTPEVLLKYGRELGIDFARWTLLTGPEQQVRKLVTDGFKSHLGQKRANANGVVDIAHPGAIGLVDQAGGFRGFYATDAQGLDEIFHRSLHVRHPE
jgi:protein SCO1/2